MSECVCAVEGGGVSHVVSREGGGMSHVCEQCVRGRGCVIPHVVRAGREGSLCCEQRGR